MADSPPPGNTSPVHNDSSPPENVNEVDALFKFHSRFHAPYGAAPSGAALHDLERSQNTRPSHSQNLDRGGLRASMFQNHFGNFGQHGIHNPSSTFNISGTQSYRKKPPTQLKCTICHEKQDSQQMIAVSCGCVYCRSCLKRRITRAIEAEYMSPARCCNLTIDLPVIRTLLSPDVLRDYEAKTIEYSSTDRTYCANRTCSAFVGKDNIQGDKAVCTMPQCHTATCTKCKGEWHEGDCPVDENLQLLLAEAKKQDWKKCTKCGTLIEFVDGCNHMTCQCGYEFCYSCTAKWKTCYCDLHDIDRILRVAHPRSNREFLTDDGEGNIDNIDSRGHGRVRRSGGVDRSLRRGRLPDLRWNGEHGEGEGDGKLMDTSILTPMRETMGTFERWAQDFPARQSSRLFDGRRGTSMPRINDYSRSILPSYLAENSLYSVQPANSSTFTRQNINLVADNTITHDDCSQANQQDPDPWSSLLDQVEGETNNTSLKALGARFANGMPELRDLVQSFENRVGHIQGMTHKRLAHTTHQNASTSPDTGLDAETNPSIGVNINYLDEHANSIPISSPLPRIQNSRSSLENQPELSSVSATNIQGSTTVDDTLTST